MRAIELQKKDEIIFISLNRPKKRNALNPDLIEDLFSVFKKTRSDSSLRAVVLSGEGPAFCAGADLKWLSNEKLFNKTALKQLFSLLKLMSDYPLPIVGMAHGYAIGGGIGLLSVCDIVIAEQNTQFRFSETQLGLVPSIISPFIIKKMGISHAKMYMLSALAFSAEEAKLGGLVHFIGSSSACDQYLKRLLDNFKKLDLQALRKTKALLNSIVDRPLQDIQSQCVDLIADMRKSSSAKKRISKLFK